MTDKASYQHRIQRPPPAPTTGFLMIAGIVAAVYALAFLVRALSAATGFRYGWALIWAGGAALAAWVMRARVLAYRYAWAHGTLTVERLYGRRAKPLVRIERSALCELGAPDIMRKKHAPTATLHCALGGVAPTRALIYRLDGAKHMLIFQPDAQLSALIESACR